MQNKKKYIPNVNLNLNVRGLLQSATLRINQVSEDLRKQGMIVFRVWILMKMMC